MEISGVLITMKRRFFLAIFLLPLSLVFQMASAATTGVSSNWAGYVASGGTFTAVGGNWIVPQAVISNANLSADATWVGIGGVSGKDLIQAGTQDIIQNGTPTYTAWYELLPASLVQIPLAVHPNDGITVSIAQQSNNEWQISFSDTTTGQSYQTSVSYVSSLSSAEWIEEMPSDQRGLVSLDNFGTVSFSNCFDVQNGSRVSINGLDAQPMTMIEGNGQALATPSALGTDGASFTITRTAVAASTPAVARTGRWSRTGVGVQGYTPSSHVLVPQNKESFSSGRFRYLFGNLGNSGRTMLNFFQKGRTLK
jgi:hypothetical protein